MSWLDRNRSGGVSDQDPEQLALLRALVERHPSGILIVGDDGRVLAASAALRRLFGDRPSGSNAPAFDPAVHASDPERFRARLAQIVEARRAVTSDEVLMANGRAFERDYARMTLPSGAGAHFWEYRDITDRRRLDLARRAELARLQFLVNTGAAVLYSSRPNPDYDRTSMSDNMGELLGYDASCWTQPGFWRKALHPDDASRVMTEMLHLRERGGQALEYRLRHANGQTVWVHDELRLICETEGQPVEIVGCLLDISARRQSENDLTALGRVAADVGYDVRNLLLVIAGHVHLLKRATLEGDATRWNVDEIGGAAERAASLTDRLLSAAPRPVVKAESVDTARTLGTGETVLVVEDEDAVRVFAGRALAGSGYTVLEAGRAEEALEIASRYPGPIAAILTDISMPGMSGCELARQLAAIRPTLKIIFMSGYGPDDPAVTPVSPAPSFLQKPFTPAVLAMKLREVLDQN